MSWTDICSRERAEKNDNKIVYCKYKSKSSWRKLVDVMEGNICKWKDGRILFGMLFIGL